MKQKRTPPVRRAAKASRDVKVIRVSHGVFGRANTYQIRRTIEKWGKKGYDLREQDDQPGGCAGGGYTLLTFIREPLLAEALEPPAKTKRQPERQARTVQVGEPVTTPRRRRWWLYLAGAFVGLWLLTILFPPSPEQRAALTQQAAARATERARPTATIAPTRTPHPATALALTAAWRSGEETRAALNAAAQATNTVLMQVAPTFPVFPTVDAAAVDAETMTIYSQGSLNVRACPSRTCEAIYSLADGQAVTAVGMTAGEAVRADNVVWYQVIVEQRTGYVYSEYVSQQPPAVAPTSRPVYVAPTRAPADSPYTCNGVDDLNCESFSSAAQAQAHLEMCGNEDRLDGDSDGEACEDSGW